MDDRSRDGSWEYVASGFREVGLLRNREGGFGAGCNAGASAAKNGLLLLLNSDILPAPDFLSPLLPHFEDPQVFAVGCKFLLPGGKLRGALGNRTRGEWSRGRLHLHHESDDLRLREVCPQLYANGAAMALRRDRFLAMGGFDPLFRPFYWEDVDLSYQAWKRGWTVLYEPRSLVYHDQAASTRRLYPPARVKAISEKNALLFIWKNVHHPAWLAQHLACLPRWLADDVLIEGDFTRTRGLLLALAQLGEAAARRAAAAHQVVLSDEQVLSRSRGGDG